jgi:hypothetical protein
LGQDNHVKARGLSTWFDEEKMEVRPPSLLLLLLLLQGNIKKQMAENEQCISSPRDTWTKSVAQIQRITVQLCREEQRRRRCGDGGEDEERIGLG